MKKDRSITGIGIVIIVLGAVMALCIPGYLVGLAMILHEEEMKIGIVDLFLTSLCLLLGAPVLVIGGINILYLKEWARRMVVYFLLISTTMHILKGIFLGEQLRASSDSSMIFASYIGSCINIFLAWYLSRNKARECFHCRCP